MRTVATLVAIVMVFSTIQTGPVGASAPPPQAQAERFVVVLEDGADPQGLANMAANATGGRVGFIYENSIKGFTIEMPAAAVNGLRNMPGVAFIEPDAQVTVAAQTESTGYDRIDADLNPSGADYSAVDIAVIDTGIWFDTTAGVSHEDLKLRWITDCTGAMLYPLFGNCTPGGVDGNGHGTHVAGIAAACDNGLGSRGVAPCATLWSFKAINDDGTGFLGSILAAVDLVAANADEIEVANMSLTLTESQALNDAIDAAVAAGVVFVVAAGNDSHDASLSSPASADSAITVSSVTDFDGLPGGLAEATCYSDVDDQLAGYSNFGPKIDIAAPGTCIYSTWLNNTYHTVTGTSMASPTVAGAAARYLHDNGIDPTTAADVAAVRDALVNGGMPQNGECGFGGDTDGYPEPLLFLNGAAFGGDGSCEGGGEPPVDDPPTAVITSATCTDLTCDFDASGSYDDNPPIASYTWDFADGTTGTGEFASHTYGAAGTYTVTLTVTDGSGQSDTATTTVNPTAPPVGDIVMTAGVEGILFDETWATVVFYVIGETLELVDGAEATGTWTYSDRRDRTRTKTVTEVSDANGLVTIRTRMKGATDISFCIDDITKPGYVYVPGFLACTSNVIPATSNPR